MRLSQAIATLSAVVIIGILPADAQAKTVLDHVRSWLGIERALQFEEYENMPFLEEVTELSLMEPVEIRMTELVDPNIVNPTVLELEQSSDSHDWQTINDWLLSGLDPSVPQVDARFDLDRIPVDTQQFLCLATNIYFEARGSTLDDQRAVALVTLNRTRHWRWQGAICDVVWERYQFSWTITANQPRNRVRTASSWLQSQEIAFEVLMGYVPDITHNATNYYNPSVVRPTWASMAVNDRRIGAHRYMQLTSTTNFSAPTGASLPERLYSRAIGSIMSRMGIRS